MKTNLTTAILQTLAELSVLYPAMRFGQLVAMVASLAAEETPLEVAEMEEEVFLQTARTHCLKRGLQLGIGPLDLSEGLTSQRRELLQVFQTLAEGTPPGRFGQLIAWAADWAEVNLYDLEDERFLAALNKYRPTQPLLPSG